jgi:uncharacterized protein
MIKKLSIFIAILFFLLNLTSYFLSGMVLYPKSKCNINFHVFCKDPSERNLSFETVSLTTIDGIILNAWYIPNDKTTKSILLVHGHGGTKNEGLRFSKVLHDNGYNLLLIDLRRNSGTFASMGFHEVKDVLSGVNFLKEKKMTKIGIIGFSMGSATSILAMAESKSIDVGVFSSGYSSAIEVLQENAWRDFLIPKYPLFPITKFYINLRGNMNIDKVVPSEKIKTLSPRPIFIMHCKDDDYVGSHHANILFDKAKEPKDLWIPNCNKHEQLWNFQPEEAENRVLNFFQKNL